MEEAQLSISQRKDISSRMNAGEPLQIRTRSAPPIQSSNLFDMKRNFYFNKRSREKIQSAGFYDYEPYVSNSRPVDRMKETEILQHVMTYGKKPGPEKKNPKKSQNVRQVLTKEKRLEELKHEVEERVQFLHEMTELGQRARYETAIKQEIATKLRERDLLEKLTDRQFIQTFGYVY